jgi:hypothetical protein
MTTIRTACILATLTAGLFAASAGAQDKTLYQRLGGYDAVAAVTDEFIGRLATDEQEKRFFVGFSTDSKMRQLIVDLICKFDRRPVRLQRTGHEDGACRRRHHEIRLGSHAANLRRGAQQIQSAGKGAEGARRAAGAAGEGHRRQMTPRARQ